MKKTTRIVLFTAIVLVLCAAVFFLWSSKSESERSARISQSYEYSCYYHEGWDYVRCSSRSGSGKAAACLGYYDLVGTRPEDGMRPDSSGGGTSCEAFEGQPEFYYDRNGKFLD
jgi:hypothetical protein